MLRRLLPLALLALAGCHATPTFSRPPRVVETRRFEITTDLGDDVATIGSQLDLVLEDQAARWGLPVEGAAKRRVNLFLRHEDFARFLADHPFSSQHLSCAGFFCTACDATTTYAQYTREQSEQALEELVLTLLLGDRTSTLLGTLAHETHHQLLYERTGSAYGALPAWLREGAAMQEGLRAAEPLEGGFDRAFGPGPWARQRLLGAAHLLLRLLMARPCFADDDLQVDWPFADYHLHLALADALEASRPGAVRRFVTTGAPPDEPRAGLERDVAAYALLDSFDLLARWAFHPSEPAYRVIEPLLHLLRLAFDDAPTPEALAARSGEAVRDAVLATLAARRRDLDRGALRWRTAGDADRAALRQDATVIVEELGVSGDVVARIVDGS